MVFDRKKPRKSKKRKRSRTFDQRLTEWRIRMRHRLRPRKVMLRGVRLPTDPRIMPPWIVELIYDERYERAEAILCREILRPDDRVLEIGAGIGMMGSLCAKICGSANVLSYEANPTVEPLIRRTHQMNRVQPMLRMRAIGTTTGQTTFYINDNIISSSLIDRDFGGAVTVPCDALNDVIREFKPNVIVCDIEGGEVDVFPSADLSGVDRMVLELHPKVVGEEQNEALITAMAEKGLNLVSGVRSKVSLFSRHGEPMPAPPPAGRDPTPAASANRSSRS